MGMIFAVSPGSDGSGSARYAAYLPFVLAPGANLPPIEAPVEVTRGSISFRLERLHHIYALSSRSFPSEDAAAASLDELRASLLWASLRFGVGVSYSRTLSEVTLFEEPKPSPDSGPVAHAASVRGWAATDGHYDADKAAILRDDKRLTRWEMGRASLIVGISIENFFSSLTEALSFHAIQSIVGNDKLKLAIELYAAYRFELSDNAQFITLVSALESLLPDMVIADASSSVLDKAKAVVSGRRDQYPQGSDEWNAVNHLLSRLGTLKREAIGTTLRAYVSDVVSRYSDLGNGTEVSAKLRSIYSIRGALLHDGRGDEREISEALGFLRDFVPRMLTVLFKEAAKGATT
jgi:hypothetical protein